MSTEKLRTEFLYNAIQDTVSTIRAVDTKLHIVLGLYLIPLAMSDKLSNAASNWNSTHDWGNLFILQTVTVALAAFSLLVWITGVIISLRGIIAISNPIDAIKGKKPAGTFYWVGNLVRSRVFRFKIDTELTDYIKKLPEKDSDVVDELAFEQMKLAYIREVKITRHKTAAHLAILWAFCMIMTMVFYRF